MSLLLLLVGASSGGVPPEPPSDEGGKLSLMGRRRSRLERPAKGRKEEPLVDDDEWIVMV